MAFHYLTVYGTVPGLDAHLRRAHEERAAAFYAAWKAGVRVLGAPVRRLAAAIRRDRRARRTSRELNALSDHQLSDIGLTRGEIRDIAEIIAAAPPAAGVTLADLRGGGAATSADHGTVSPPPRDGRRHQRPAPWQARRPAERERAAG